MAEIVTTLRVRLPFWWRLALHMMSAWIRVRMWVGFPVDVDAEVERLGDCISRHARIETT